MNNNKILVTAVLSLFSMNILSAKAFASPRTAAPTTVTCQADTASGIVAVAKGSQDADHIYFSGHDATATYSATYHIAEKFVYLQITSGPSDNPIKTSGNFLLNGVGLSATLTYTQGTQISQLTCGE
jgi:hypothetical protein